jgi:hypothetical protein
MLTPFNHDLYTEVKATERKIAMKFPYETNNSYSSLFGTALNHGEITQEDYDKAKSYYGRLWDYAGD